MKDSNELDQLHDYVTSRLLRIEERLDGLEQTCTNLLLTMANQQAASIPPIKRDIAELRQMIAPAPVVTETTEKTLAGQGIGDSDDDGA